MIQIVTVNLPAGKGLFVWLVEFFCLFGHIGLVCVFIGFCICTLLIIVI